MSSSLAPVLPRLTQRPYQLGDCESIPLRREELHLAHVDRSQLASTAAGAVPYSYTWLWDGVPVACGGIYPLWPGVGEAWFHSGDDLPKNAGLAAAVRAVFNELCPRMGLHRVQAKVVRGFPEAHMLVAYLGFKPEAVLRKYSPDGRDYIQYAILFGDNA